jgi:hypothetical protein
LLLWNIGAGKGHRYKMRKQIFQINPHKKGGSGMVTRYAWCLAVILLCTLDGLAQAWKSVTPIRKPTKQQHPVTLDPVFPLTGKLIFEGRVVRGFVRRSEIDSLLTQRVELQAARPDAEYGKYGLGYNFPDWHFPVFSCREWAQAHRQGEYVNSNYEMAMESSFIHTCSLLYALEDAKPAKRSFIANPKVGLANLKLLPPHVKGDGLSDEEENEFNKLAVRGVRMSNLIARGEVKAKATKPSLSLAEPYDETELEEAARADFDGDGLEDIFIWATKHTGMGTLRYYYYFLLTRRSPTAGFEIRRLDVPALKVDPTASATVLELKSRQLTRARMTKKGYGKGWPFSVDEGELMCANAGSVAVFFRAGGTTYSLNAWARGSKIDGVAVSSDTRDLITAYYMGAVFNQAFAMCQTKGEKR